MSKFTEQVRVEIKDAYKVCGISILHDVVDIFAKYQDLSLESGEFPDFSLDQLQKDSVLLTAYNYTIQTYMVNAEAEADKAKARSKYERARAFIESKKLDAKTTDKRAENDADELAYKYILEEIDKRKIARYLEVAWERSQDLVNMLKKVVERMMWQGATAGA